MTTYKKRPPRRSEFMIFDEVDKLTVTATTSARARERVRAWYTAQIVTRQEWRENARDAFEFATDMRATVRLLRLTAPDPARDERVRLGIGRLTRWADERARS